MFNVIDSNVRFVSAFSGFSHKMTCQFHENKRRNYYYFNFQFSFFERASTFPRIMIRKRFHFCRNEARAALLRLMIIYKKPEFKCTYLGKTSDKIVVATMNFRKTENVRTIYEYHNVLKLFSMLIH